MTSSGHVRFGPVTTIPAQQGIARDPFSRLPLILPLAALCAATVLASEKPAPQPVDGNIHWVFDYQEGKRLSRETGKPMFVVFRCER